MLAVILTFVAVIIKNNYLIFAIGLVVYILIRFLRKTTWQMGLAFVLIITVLLFGNSFVNVNSSNEFH